MRWADEVIADARGIADHLRATHGRDVGLHPLRRPAGRRRAPTGWPTSAWSRSGYHLVVARFEPENHVDEIVDGRLAQRGRASRWSSWAARRTPRSTRPASGPGPLGDDRVRFLGSVWDQDLLDQLYANASSYLHGHSVGGTNPSLLRAMGAGAPVTAWDVVFNREVDRRAARFVRGPDDVAAALAADEHDPVAAKERGELLRERARTAYVGTTWPTSTSSCAGGCSTSTGAGVRPGR